MKKQSEAALRELCTQYSYESVDKEEHTLTTHQNEIAMKLVKIVQEHLSFSGIRIIEARVSHLAYAPEIAREMLKRQQASAILAARSKVVEGAVGMTLDALKRIDEKGIARMDTKRREEMISKMLVVLISDDKK